MAVAVITQTATIMITTLVTMPTTTATVGAIAIETTTTTTAATTDYYITFQSAEVLVLRRFWLTTLKRLTTADYVFAHFVRCITADYG